MVIHDALGAAPEERRICEGRMIRKVLAFEQPVELPELTRRWRRTVLYVEPVRLMHSHQSTQQRGRKMHPREHGDGVLGERNHVLGTRIRDARRGKDPHAGLLVQLEVLQG